MRHIEHYYGAVTDAKKVPLEVYIGASFEEIQSVLYRINFFAHMINMLSPRELRIIHNFRTDDSR